MAASALQSKTPPQTPLRTPKHGHGKLRVGGTNKGGPGRTPDEFKKLCAELACTGAEAAKLVMPDPKHPAYLGALRWASEHGYGKPKESREISGKLTIVVERDP